MMKEKYVYYMYAPKSNMVKIGSSVSPENRMRTISSDGPENFIILATEPGNVYHENYTHKKFSKYRKKGEWFECSDEIKEHINCIKDIDWDFNISGHDINILKCIGESMMSIDEIQDKSSSSGIDCNKTIKKLHLLRLIHMIRGENGEPFKDKNGGYMYVLTATGKHEMGGKIVQCPHCHKEIN